MRNFQNTFDTRKQSFISAFSICMILPLKEEPLVKHNPRKLLETRYQYLKSC